MVEDNEAVEKILSIIHNKWFTLTCRLLLGFLFLFTACVKLPDIKMRSVNAVYEYGILPVEPVNLAAAFGYALPFLELFAGLALVLGILTRLAAIGGGLLGLSFTIGEAVVLLQGRNINCGCFGGIMDTLVSQTLYLSILIVVLSILIATSPNLNFLSLGNKLGMKTGKFE